MDQKKRQYFFDGRSILLDQYDESVKFDQNFDESEHFPMSASNSNINFYQSNNSNKFSKNFKQQNLSNNTSNIVQEQPNEDPNSQSILFFYYKLIDYENNNSQYQPQLIPVDKISDLKNFYYKKKGYIEHNPQTILNFVNEFKSLQKV